MKSQAELDCVAHAAAEEGQLIVAFASSDGDIVNQHFGSAQGFYVYGIGPDEAALLTSKTFAKEKKDGNEDKLKPKLAWLVGSDIVYCGSVGGSATRQLVSLGAHPVVVKGGPDIEEIVEELQNELKGTPSPMLERILRQKAAGDENRFNAMAEEAWDED